MKGMLENPQNLLEITHNSNKVSKYRTKFDKRIHLYDISKICGNPKGLRDKRL